MNAHVKCDSDACPFEGDPHDRRGWHLEKSINLPALLTLLGIIAGGIAYVQHQDTRVTKVEDRATALESADVRIESAVRVQKDDLVKKVDRIEDKVDQILAERRR